MHYILLFYNLNITLLQYTKTNKTNDVAIVISSVVYMNYMYVINYFANS